jgi:hypothetical protein
MVYDPYEEPIDGPTEADALARYYGTAPVGPAGEHTTTLSYRSFDGSVFTHDFYATSVELVQLGVGDDAKVFDVDPETGALSPSAAPPVDDIPVRAAYQALFGTFGR